jgi:tRNA G10  N-methylase Trm11
MQVGMMPAKLTHMMINIGLTYTAMDAMDNIYDPFCGLGTTLLMANTL